MPHTVLFLVSLLLAVPAWANDIVGMAKVVSSNVLRIGQSEIQLYGIKAPERGQVCTPFNGGAKIPCGNMAFQALRKLIPEAPVSCAPTGKTRNNRILAQCRYLQKDFNKLMVQGGWARAVPGEGLAYMNLEKNAVLERKGLWQFLIGPPAP
ncbi:hypothetical protein JCM17960_06910 [Magnetospira thiophila]